MHARSRLFKASVLCCAAVAVGLAARRLTRPALRRPTTTTTTSTGSSSTWQGGGDGIWRRDANSIYGEIYTFDSLQGASAANRASTTTTRIRLCLRYQLNDNIVGTNVGTAERDVYRGNGLADALAAIGLGVRRVSGVWAVWLFHRNEFNIFSPAHGFELRDPDGQYVNADVSAGVGGVVNQGISQTLTATEYGPPVNATYPFGRYVEDYDYTAASGESSTVQRRCFCVTPEFRWDVCVLRDDHGGGRHRRFRITWGRSFTGRSRRKT